MLGLCLYANMGWAVSLAIDVRGQNGESNSTSFGEDGAVKGWMTIGIEAPKTTTTAAPTQIASGPLIWPVP